MTIDAVVDTAAQVSVISENLYKRLHPNPKIKGHVLLKGISGTNIDSKIFQNVPLLLGNFKTMWNFAIANIDESVILVLDFLEHNKVDISLHNFSLSIAQNIISAKCVANKNKERIDILRVQIKKRVFKLPRSSVYAEIMFDKSPNSDVVINPC